MGKGLGAQAASFMGDLSSGLLTDFETSGDLWLSWAQLIY